MDAVAQRRVSSKRSALGTCIPLSCRTVLATILYRYILHEGAKHPLNPLSHAVQEMPSKVDRVARLVRALVVNPRERR